MPTIVTPTQYPSFVPSLTASNAPVAGERNCSSAITGNRGGNVSGNVYCLLSLHNNVLTISCDDPGHSSAPDPGPRRRTLRLSAAKPIDCRTPVAFLTARFSPGNTTGNHSGNKNGKSGKIGNAKPSASNEPIPDAAWIYPHHHRHTMQNSGKNGNAAQPALGSTNTPTTVPKKTLNQSTYIEERAAAPARKSAISGNISGNTTGNDSGNIFGNTSGNIGKPTSHAWNPQSPNIPAFSTAPAHTNENPGKNGNISGNISGTPPSQPVLRGSGCASDDNGCQALAEKRPIGSGAAAERSAWVGNRYTARFARVKNEFSTSDRRKKDEESTNFRRETDEKKRNASHSSTPQPKFRGLLTPAGSPAHQHQRCSPQCPCPWREGSSHRARRWGWGLGWPPTLLCDTIRQDMAW